MRPGAGRQVGSPHQMEEVVDVSISVLFQHRGREDHGGEAAAGEVQLQEAESTAEQDDRQLYCAQQEAQLRVPPGPVPPQHLLPADGEPRPGQLQAAERQQLAAGGGGRPGRSVQEDHPVPPAGVRGPAQGRHLPGGRSGPRDDPAWSRGHG